jgi:hypothetical protein
MGTTVTNKSYIPIHEEVKIILNSGNDCCHSVQNPLPSNEELHGLYSSPSIVRVIKARRMRWAGHVARMGEVRGA